VGRGFAFTILDIVDDNPISRIPLSRFKNLEGVRNDVAATLNKSLTGRKRFNRKNNLLSKPTIKVKVNNLK